MAKKLTDAQVSEMLEKDIADGEEVGALPLGPEMAIRSMDLSPTLRAHCEALIDASKRRVLARAGRL